MNRKWSNEQKVLQLQAVVEKIKKSQAAERVSGVLDNDSRIKTLGSKSILYSVFRRDVSYRDKSPCTPAPSL